MATYDPMSNAPPDIQQAYADNLNQQKMAQILRQQAMAPVQTQMVQGTGGQPNVPVRQSPWLRLLQGVAGGYMDRQAGERQSALANQLRAIQQEKGKAFASATPEQQVEMLASDPTLPPGMMDMYKLREQIADRQQRNTESIADRKQRAAESLAQREAATKMMDETRRMGLGVQQQIAAANNATRQQSVADRLATQLLIAKMVQDTRTGEGAANRSSRESIAGDKSTTQLIIAAANNATKKDLQTARLDQYEKLKREGWDHATAMQSAGFTNQRDLQDARLANQQDLQDARLANQRGMQVFGSAIKQQSGSRPSFKLVQGADGNWNRVNVTTGEATPVSDVSGAPFAGKSATSLRGTSPLAKAVVHTEDMVKKYGEGSPQWLAAKEQEKKAAVGPKMASSITGIETLLPTMDRIEKTAEKVNLPANRLGAFLKGSTKSFTDDPDYVEMRTDLNDLSIRIPLLLKGTGTTNLNLMQELKILTENPSPQRVKAFVKSNRAVLQEMVDKYRKMGFVPGGNVPTPEQGGADSSPKIGTVRRIK